MTARAIIPRAAIEALELANVKIVRGNHGGKAMALNQGLEHVSHDILVCIDADTFLHPQALRRIVTRFLTDPQDTAAVAGCVLVKNSRASFMTRLQEWDYFTGIASAKRQQSLYQGTLVAQGAFSAFHSKIIKAHKGWPSVIGEDIVMTWALIKSGWRIGFEPSAIGFTSAPTSFSGFYRQRKRWARGMIEGLKQHGRLVWSTSRLAAFFVAIDFIIPFIDLFYAFVFLPGVLLALFGQYYIVGPMTLLVMPLAFLIVLVMYKKQKAVFDVLTPESAAKFRRLLGLHDDLSSDHVANLRDRLCPRAARHQEAVVEMASIIINRKTVRHDTPGKLSGWALLCQLTLIFSYTAKALAQDESDLATNHCVDAPTRASKRNCINNSATSWCAKIKLTMLPDLTARH